MSKINEVAELVEKGKAKLVGPAVQEAIDEGDDPVAILNDGMISAMSVVGEKFKNGEIFVPEMLVAARAMKKGVEVLKPHLASGSTGALGKVIIATVSGDLHDIGKNLVAMMIESAGFEVIDLGVDVPASKVIECYRENPDVKVIDATEGGALIHGSIVMTLDEAINRECINQLDLKSVITGIEPQFSLVEQEEIYTYLEGIEGELDRIKGLLGDGIKAYNRLRDALKSGNNELARAELEKVGITNSLDKREPLFSLIRKYAVEERYRVNDELSRSESDDSMAAVNSGIELLESYIKGIDKMREDIHLLN